MVNLPSKLFVTGTDTNVGKTLVSAILVSGLNACYWKPVQSGAIEGTDRAFLQSITGLPQGNFFDECYVLQEPLSPHEAARLEGVKIELDRIELPDTSGRPLVVEGAGGLLVPLNENCLIIDLIDRLALPVVLVARSSLGTINHTLLSLQCLRSRNIDIAGVVMNGEPNPANRHAIEFYGKVRVLAEIPILQPLNNRTVEKAFDHFALNERNHATTR